jgi:hypothetical protein
MNRILLSFIFLFLCFLHGKSQFYEDFSSSSLATNNWQGMIDTFKISTSTAIPAELRPGLQLDDVIANTSYICAPYAFNFTDSVEWSFWIKLSFMATVNNFARVYIVSDQLDVTGSLNGYFIGIGETDKKLTLVKQTGTTLETLITGTVADLSASTNVVRVRVIRYSSGLWKLFSDITGGTAWIEEGTATDATYTSSAWQGLYCKYTVSNVTKVYFDDFYAGNVQSDTIKPEVSNLQVASQFQLNVTFSEVVDSTDAVLLANYSVDNSIGSPTEILQDGSNPMLFYLSFANPFPENVACTLSVSNISDPASNVMDPQQIQFAYYLTQPYDILIHEIMADPSPVVGLPEYEYVELFNNTGLPISINNWKLHFGTTVKTFSNVTIPAGGYLIVTGSSGAGELSAFGAVYDMGSISVTNDGQTLNLLDNFDRLVHSVSFTTSWYQDSNKDDGGWSLEMIDPDNPCGGMSNWRASVNTSGGTPGTPNSVTTANPDNLAPQLIRVSVVNDQQIRVWFSESLDSLELLNPLAYQFSHGLTLSGNPDPVWPSYQSVILSLSQAMQQTTIYSLTVADTITDCAGNILPLQSEVRFALTEPLEPGDIVINEVLSNPPAGLYDFVEIYNLSEKIIDLKEMNLANIDDETGNVASLNPIATDGFLIFPGDHIILSRNIEGLKNYYYCPYPNNFIEMVSMPSYNNDDGNVVLVHVGGEVIDRFDYDVSMHFPLLSETKGVSLERINYERPTDDITNWHSASETAGFATPGYKNSQYSDVVFDGEIIITPDIFSPDNDGYNDVLNISYSFSESGYVGTILIFDSRGRLIRNLVMSELLGTSGTYSWDGITEDNQKAAIGIYIVYFEFFDIQGVKRSLKNVAVLGGYINR